MTMRPLLIAALLATAPTLALADHDTAYKALRVFGKQQGENLLNRVVELRGRSGVPQPQVWKVVASDPAARGGLVEAEVQRGRIISQRTPTSRGGGGEVMDLNKLNLDSDGAFTVADQEMQRRTIPFDRIDYTLRGSVGGQAPIWTLDLYDRGSKVAILRLAADTGSILEHEVFAPNRPPSRGPSNDRDYVEERRDDRDRDRRPGYEKAGESVGNFFRRVGRHFEKRGHQLKNFFTGDE
jgi:hypothetical protein